MSCDVGLGSFICQGCSLKKAKKKKHGMDWVSSRAHGKSRSSLCILREGTGKDGGGQEGALRSLSAGDGPRLVVSNEGEAVPAPFSAHIWLFLCFMSLGPPRAQPLALGRDPMKHSFSQFPAFSSTGLTQWRVDFF